MLNKKTILMASAIISVGALLTGCSSNTASPSVTVTETYEAPEITQPTPQENYLNSLHSFGNPYIENNKDSDLLDLGYAVCSVFDDGYTAEEVVAELAYGVFGQEHAGDSDAFSFVGYVIGAATANLCPEYLPMVQNLVYG